MRGVSDRDAASRRQALGSVRVASRRCLVGGRRDLALARGVVRPGSRAVGIHWRRDPPGDPAERIVVILRDAIGRVGLAAQLAEGVVRGAARAGVAGDIAVGQRQATAEHIVGHLDHTSDRVHGRDEPERSV